MIFHFQQRSVTPNGIPCIQINGHQIERVKEFDYLGLIVDECLHWDSHVNKISNKISIMNGIINRLKNTLPCSILKLMYDSFILPHINYCITAWGYNLKRVTKLQKKSIRILCKANYIAHTDPLFKKIILSRL